MEALPKALFLVMLELTVGAFFTLYLLDVRGNTSRGYILFQGVLYALLALLTELTMGAFASPEHLRGYGLDAAWLAWQQPLVLAFSLLILPWNVLLWMKRTRARQIVGGLAALAGVAAVFSVGMAYRPLASAHLGGAFVVGAFLAGSLALGGVVTAMLLGHWYLNTPTASGKPLEFTTALLLGALLAELICSLALGPSTAHPLTGAVPLAPGTIIRTSGQTVIVTTPTPVHAIHPGQPVESATPRETPIDTTAMVWLQYSLGFLAPLTLGAVALWLTRGRSFQSATGMLYLCTAFIFIGEILGRGLLLFPVQL
jgi:hypothetical protein